MGLFLLVNIFNSFLAASFPLMQCREHRITSATRTIASFSFLAATAPEKTTTDNAKQQLVDLLALVPRNAVTSRRQTREILDTVRQLEVLCPTRENPTALLPGLAGTWELLWTAQDDQNNDTQGLSAFRWINPLENQAYSNNPDGRANPLLPLEIQKFLTEKGFLTEPDDKATSDSGRTSTQTIDVEKGRVTNVVSLPIRGSKSPAALTVRVDFVPDDTDFRRVNVKFQSFAVAWGTAIKWNFPLGLIGPTGWLRTTYLDDDFRITRGHKSSVFVLRRPATKRRASREE